jgi:hypothetical protein
MNPRVSRFRKARVLWALLLISSAAFSSAGQTAAISSGDLASLTHYESVVPELRDEIYDETAALLPIYDVAATFTPAGTEPATISGTTNLNYVNFTNSPQAELHFRLYPNLPIFNEGEIAIETATVGGLPVEPRYDLADTLVTLPLADMLQPGERIQITLDFVSTVPLEPEEAYGMFEYEAIGRSYNLAHWQPLLAGWDPDSGWNIGPVDMRGDPVFTNTSLFSVQLVAPTELVFATTGVEVATFGMGSTTIHTWESGPTRDFVMVANPGFDIAEQLSGDVLVRSFSSPELEPVAPFVLDATVASLEFFGASFGEYPYREFDLAEARIGPRAAGIEYPGMVYISRDLYQIGHPSLEFTIAHEVAHQWWYALVGNNQYEHAFLDESLANYVSVLYLENRYGVEIAEQALNQFLKRPYFSALFGVEGDLVVDQPNTAFPSDRAYGRTVYGKGALGMHAIREAIGLDAFLAGLRDYVALNQFGVAEPDDLLAAFERASGQDLSSSGPTGSSRLGEQKISHRMS